MTFYNSVQFIFIKIIIPFLFATFKVFITWLMRSKINGLLFDYALYYYIITCITFYKLECALTLAFNR